MKKLKSILKRITALGLCAMMVFGDVPMTSYAEDPTPQAHTIYTYDSDASSLVEVGPVAGNTYISDSNTINGWKNYFTDQNTEYAGAVWTDKAVFTNGSSTTAIPSDFVGMDKAAVLKENGVVSKDSDGNIQMTTEAGAYTAAVGSENFLVSMSALGSTKQITGYSALPSDTVFILDVSNSMSSDDLAKMVEATNKAINQLFTLNNHNRVGIVVYGTSADTLLSIDRYTTTKTEDNDTTATEDDYPVYIEISRGSGNQSNQIVTARSTETTENTITRTANEITDTTWNAVLNNIPDRDDYGYFNGQAWRRAVAQHLERALSTTIVGFDINWQNEISALNQSGSDMDEWNSSEWKQALLQVIADNATVTTTTTSTTNHLKDSDSNEVIASVNIGGATYMQGGINAARELFEAMEGDTTIDTGLIQGGTARLPITVFMTDGAPTYASTDYTDADNGENTLGNGGSDSISDRLVFPTQLSAAYLSQQMEAVYGREALIYTLGLGIEYAEAHRVMNPSNNTSETIESYWNGEDRNGNKIGYENTVQGQTIAGYSYGSGQNTQRITRLENVDDSLANYRYYVDEYFAANDSDDLVGAFNSIVEAIIIQSKYYPTLVESGAHDFDGYLTFEDEIGEFMEVKEIEGIVLGNTIYTGAAFLDALNHSDAFGNATTWSTYGEELLKSISERIGIAENEARSLLAAAYRAGGTNADGTPVNQTGQLWDKNYIGWYADAQGHYLGHWDDELHTEANYPEGAVYLNKCYIFQGDLTNAATTVKGGDMMHIVVQVHEEVETGNQCVIWKIPANLIPLVTYNITVDSNSLDTANNISVDVKEEEPIRLLYEVGLSDEINDVNMMETVGASDHNHPVKDENGNTVGYAFYSNRWGAGHILDGSGSTDVLDPTANLATVSHFHPSEQNERYYYTEDSIIYTKDGEVYKGDTKPTDPTGTNYYHVYRIIEKIEGTDNYKVTKKFVPIASNVLEAEGNLALRQITDENDANYGAWYIPAGQIYQQIARHQQKKDDQNTTGVGKDGIDPNAQGNVTATLEYYDYPIIVHGAGDDYNIYDFLGNNGRLVKYSATGIKLSKTIDNNTAAGTETFTFNITLAAPSGGTLAESYPTVLAAVDGTQTTGTATVDNGVITVSVKNGEAIYITGLAEGTTYTVSEARHEDYAVKEVKLNGAAVNGTTVTHTATQYVIDSVEFINKESSHKGDLVVTKTVTHPYGSDYTINPDLEFSVVVNLGTANATYDATGTVSNGEAVSSTLTTDGNGNITLVLGHEDSVTIKGIPEDTAYTVTETIDTAHWNNSASTGLTGTIISDSTVEAYLANDLETITTVDTSDMSIVLTKDLTGVTAWEDGWKFDFIVERYDADSTSDNKWVNILGEGEVFTIDSADEDKTITIAGTTDAGAARITFTKDDLGMHYYRITEAEGSIDGITYDTTHRYFYFVVSDTNTDGVLEITVVNYAGTTVATVDNKTTIAATFTNYYDSAVAEISLEKTLTNTTGVDVSMDSFKFEFCEDNPTDGHNCPDVNKHLVLPVNVEGKLTFPQVYTEADLSEVLTWSYFDVTDGQTKEITEDKEDPNQEIPEGATKTKTFSYYLWEQAGDVVGMTYDKSVYRVDVVVAVTKGTTNNDIKVVSTTVTKIVDVNGNTVADPVAGDIATFSNTYQLDPTTPAIAIEAAKNLNGRNMLAGEFEFSLYNANYTFNYAETDRISSYTVTGGSNSETFILDLPIYSTAGTYYYVLRENIGTNAAITYDPSVYHITVVVGAPESGEAANLEVEFITVNEVGGATGTYNGPFTGTEKITIKGTLPVEFENSYQIVQNATVTLRGDKDLAGKNLLADEYTFGLYYDVNGTNPVQVNGVDVTAKNLATSGAFTFTELQYTTTGEHTYYIKEVIPETEDVHVDYDKSVYKVVINVTDTDGNGVLDISQTITKVVDAEGSTLAAEAAADVVKFTNAFTPDPVSVTFTGEKTYVTSKNEFIEVADWPAEGFTFNLYAADSNFRVTDNTPAASVTSGNTFTGTWNANTGKFDGSQAATATDTTIAPFKLDLTFKTAGSYYYVLREAEGTAPSLRYDTKEYYLTVIVTDYTGSGVLTPTISMTYGGQRVEEAEFRNQLVEQTVDVQVKVTKDLVNTTGVVIPYNTFLFGLYTDEACTIPAVDSEGKQLTSAASTSGDASFNFHYDNDALASGNSATYTYYAKEIIPDTPVAGMTYDQSVYKVVITVEYDNGVLEGYDTITQIADSEGNPIAEADRTVDADNEMVFQNKYELDDTEIIITGTKTLTGRDIIDGEFTFALHEAAVTTNSSNAIVGWTTGNQIGENVTNTGAMFSFPVIPYSAVGTHYYVIKEVVPAGADGNITYDSNEYLVEVNVIDNGNGALSVTSKVVGKGYTDAQIGQKVYTWATAAAPLTLNIENEFTPDAIVVEIGGIKTLIGRAPRNDEFSFELYETGADYVISNNAVPIKTVKNEGDEFTFTAEVENGEYVKTDKLYFADADTRYFVLKEVVGNDPTITYSTTEHNIKVVVTKNSRGILIPLVEEVNTESASVEIVNTYTAKEATATVNIKKNLVNETGLTYDITDFEFGVYKDVEGKIPYTGTDIVVSGLDSHGNAMVAFNYTDVDYIMGSTNTETFYIMEESGTVPGMSYDTSVYKVDVVLSYDADKNLIATPTITKVVDVDNDLTNQPVATAEFRNEYSLGSVAVEISGSKAYDGWINGDENETFTVELYKTGELGNYAEDGVLIGEATVGKDSPNFTFTSEGATSVTTDPLTSELTFKTVGTYYFVVREDNGGLTQNEIIYDGKQYVVVVTVSPDNTTNPTKLEVSTHKYLYGHDSSAVEEDIAFTNITLTGKTTVDIIGKKQLTDNDIIKYDKAFDFELYRAEVVNNEWNLVDENVATTDVIEPFLSTVNREKEEEQANKEYNIEFVSVPIEYEQGQYEYYFVLKELDGSDPTITYDSAEYRIQVIGKFDNENKFFVEDAEVWKSVQKEGVVSWKEIGNAYNSNGQVICIDSETGYSFVNDYDIITTSESNTHAVVPIEKALTNDTGVTSVTVEGFTFGLFEDKAGTKPVNAEKSVEAGKDVYTPVAAATATSTNVTVVSDAAGEATINLRYTDTMYDAVRDHTYTYYLKEIKGSVAGMTYDEHVYEIKVVLSYNANKDLVTTTTITEVTESATSAQASVSEATFRNTYELDPAKIILEGVKELEGHDALKSDFVFSLYKASVGTDGKWTVDTSVAPITATNDYKIDSTATGSDYDKFVFEEISLDKAGEYYFIIRENAGKLGGVTYDDSEYHVTVNVVADDKDNVDSDGDNAMNDLVATAVVEKYDAEGKLVTETVDKNNDGIADIVFNNSYVPEGKFSLGGTKEIALRDWLDTDEFTFNLYKTGEDFVVADNAAPIATDTVKGTDADRAFNFADVEISGAGTHYFVLKEATGNVEFMKYDSSEYHITIEAIDNLDGTMKLGRYEVADSETPDVKTFVENEFDIQQIQKTSTLIFFKTTTVLNADVEMDEIVFVNEYQTNPVTAEISGIKKLTTKVAEDREIQDDEFAFELYTAIVEQDGSELVWTVAPNADKEVTNKGESFTFSADSKVAGDVLTFTQAGDYYFVIKEVVGTNSIMTYDATEHRIKVAVSDKGDTDNDGKANLEAIVYYVDAEGEENVLNAEGNKQIIFHNICNDTKVTLNIAKAVTNNGDITHTRGGFEFQIKNVTTDHIYKARPVSDNNGNTSFTVTYDETDIGKTYVYEITEINTGIKDMTYDTTVHKAEVTLVVVNGELKAEIVLDGVSVENAEVKFNNTYNGNTPKPDEPDEPGETIIVENKPNTGDNSNIVLYISLITVSAVLIAVLVILHKKRGNKAEA